MLQWHPNCETELSQPQRWNGKYSGQAHGFMCMYLAYICEETVWRPHKLFTRNTAQISVKVRKDDWIKWNKTVLWSCFPPQIKNKNVQIEVPVLVFYLCTSDKLYLQPDFCESKGGRLVYLWYFNPMIVTNKFSHLGFVHVDNKELEPGYVWDQSV